MKKLVSVFVPYYNDSAFLRDCIESILNQSYEMFELILLDHASTDDSSQIAHSYTDKRIKHISLHRNLGAGGGALVHEFLNMAKGLYIKLFCADDIMHHDCIANFVDYMEANPQVDIVFGNVKYVDVNSSPLKGDWFYNHKYFNINDEKKELLDKFKEGKSFLPYIGSFAKREAFAHVKLEKTFIMVFDMTLWIGMLLNNRRIAFLDKIVASYRIHGKQESSAKNSEKISARSFYESIAFCDVFYSYIKDVGVLKNVFSESPFIDRLNEKDVDFIEFIIAHWFFISQHEPFKINAYLRLEKMLSDDCLRNKIEAKFSYGIVEFRRDYSAVPSLSFKRRVYKKKPDNLNLCDIIYLLLRGLWNVLSLRKVRKKKKYTL